MTCCANEIFEKEAKSGVGGWLDGLQPDYLGGRMSDRGPFVTTLQGTKIRTDIVYESI